MSNVYYDLHLHSCLSPCGDNDMTPHNIANMAVLNGLSIIALTDHNSCKNCPAIIKAAEKLPLIVVPGMELCTSEEVHVVCLFYHLEDAMAFDSYVHSKLPDIKNRPDIFGEQKILDEQDNPIGIEEKLLINAADISVMDLKELSARFHMVCFPAHIDKSSNSIIANLGWIPDECGFTAVEIAHLENIEPYREQFPNILPFHIVTDSDAHYLWDIAEAVRTLPDDIQNVAALLDFLKSSKRSR